MFEMRSGDRIHRVRMDRDLQDVIDFARRHHSDAGHEIIDEPNLQIFQPVQGKVALRHVFMIAAGGAKRREDEAISRSNATRDCRYQS